MMKKINTLNRIIDSKIVAVIRSENIKEAIRVSDACIQGGIKAIEVTYTIPNATDVIKCLKEEFADKNLLIGAGTVLDSTTARIAILAGAEYIVSPHFEKSIAKLCNLYQIPYLAGCMTIKEITTAMEYGVDIVKLFPGSAFGPSFIKAIKAPLPQANIMPTGGVNLENIREWFSNGVVAVGIGGNLASGTSEEIIKASKEFIEKIKGV
ncbi:bifunctional 2-keto-4-hydroxyglutarate aldolase/2-keto-3-deoxy-6-phosphogluconate aldolase [Cetobacterium sp. 2A]|nr:bifunctional 2-keto-4-hydroxyglutarate aldolase/2-keto-3-deoxy-6-phosphogluconate aldolase [Cetobacterium sp. 2A]